MRQEADDGTENEESPTAKLERDIKTGEIALIVINGLLLVTTIVIAVIYSGQLKQMRKATEASRKAADAAVQAMHIDDRAWVDISTGPAELILGQPLLVPIIIANNGKTSAFNIRGRIVLNVLLANEDPDLTLVDATHPAYNVSVKQLPPRHTETPKAAVFPKYIGKGEILTPIKLTAVIRKQIMNGRMQIVVQARLAYEDVFGVKHWIQHCSHGFGTKSWPGIRLSNVGPTGICGEYNDADKNF